MRGASLYRHIDASIGYHCWHSASYNTVLSLFFQSFPQQFLSLSHGVLYLLFITLLEFIPRGQRRIVLPPLFDNFQFLASADSR